jgi:hypothetical protein
LSYLHTALLNMVILDLLVCRWWWCELVHPVPMLTVNRSCHSFLLVELFIDAFTLFQMGTVKLGCPYLGAWLGIFGSTYIHTLLRNGLSYVHSKTGDKHINVIHYIDPAIGKGQLDLLLPTPSVRHNYFE